MVNSKPQSYKDLEIYKKSQELAVRVHRMTLEKLPRFEMNEEGGQIRCSSKGIVLNIVEGFGRKRYLGDYAKHLPYALAECDETKEHLEMLFETKSLTDQVLYNELHAADESLGRMIYRFREAVLSSSDKE